MRIAIAGGGPAGLLVAASLRWSDAVVVEASRRPGVPPHCTGVVSPWTAERLLEPLGGSARGELVEAVYREAVFLDRGLREACRLGGAPLAVKLRRPGLEEALASAVEARGHRVLLGARASALSRINGGYELLLSSGGRVEADRVVVATGFSASGRLPRPWLGRCQRIHAVEARLRLDKRIEDEAFYTIHGTSLAPGFYAWIAPVDGGRWAVAGLGSRSSRGLWARLQRLIHLLEARLTGVSGISEARGGPIATGPPGARPLENGVAWIGDTLCASKPYTGGGLYAIARLAPALAAALDGRNSPGLQREWGLLRRELLLQHAAAKLARAAGPLFPRILAVACRGAEKGRCGVDFDRHSSLLRCLAAGLLPGRG